MGGGCCGRAGVDPPRVYFGGQVVVSQQGARCHHRDLRTRATGHCQKLQQHVGRGQRARLLLNVCTDVKAELQFYFCGSKQLEADV